MPHLGKIPDSPTVIGLEIPITVGLHAIDMPDTSELFCVVEDGIKALIVGLYDPLGAKTERFLRVAVVGEVLPETHSYTYVGNFSLGGAPKLVFLANMKD